MSEYQYYEFRAVDRPLTNYFNKTPQDYGRLTRWMQEVLRAIEHESFFPNFGWGLPQLPVSLALLEHVSVGILPL